MLLTEKQINAMLTVAIVSLKKDPLSGAFKMCKLLCESHEILRKENEELKKGQTNDAGRD